MSAQRRAMLDPFYGLTPLQARSFAEGLDQARQRQLARLLMGTVPAATPPSPPCTTADIRRLLEELCKMDRPVGRRLRDYPDPLHLFPGRRPVREYPFHWVSFLVTGQNLASGTDIYHLTIRHNPKRSPLGYQPEPDA